MGKVLVVYLKDTIYTGAAGTAQWNSIKWNSDELEVVILGSGSLGVFQYDEENGRPNSHLGGKRTNQVAFFPSGGWSGYCWEPIDEGALVIQAAASKGIAIPR